MKNELIHTLDFKIRAGEIMPDKQIGFPHLVQLMQETSLDHIIKLGASKWDKVLEGYTWVLLRKRIDLHHPPALGDNITITTYPSGFQKIFAYRDYIVRDENKDLIASASSTWALIDIKTKKPVVIPTNLYHLDVSQEIEPLPRCKTKIKLPIHGQNINSVQVGRYDLDWNGHVNNIQYLRYLLGTSEHKIEPRNVEIHFKNEAFYKESLEVIQHEEVGSTTLFSIKNSEDKDIVHAAIRW